MRRWLRDVRDRWRERWHGFLHWKDIWKQCEQAKARELSERQWRYAREREIDVLRATISSLEAQRHEPLAEAKKLLAVMADILTPVFCGNGEDLNMYELRCWQYDYRQFKQNLK